MLPVVGVQYTELRLDGELRRTVVRHTTTEKRLAAERWAARCGPCCEAGPAVDPTPAWAALRSAARSAAVPHAAARRRRHADARHRLPARPADDVLEEGRLGGTSWGMGRGAAPPRWDTPSP